MIMLCDNYRRLQVSGRVGRRIRRRAGTAAFIAVRSQSAGRRRRRLRDVRPGKMLRRLAAEARHTRYHVISGEM